MTQSLQDDTVRAVRLIRRRLRHVRRAGRAMLTTRAVSWLCVWGLVLTAALIGADRLMRFPTGLRVVVLLGLLILTASAVRRRLVPVTRFKPRLSDVAMRVERWMTARGADPAGPIASGIGMPLDDTDPLTRRLSRIVAAEAASGLRSTPWGLLRWGKPMIALGAAVMAAVLLAVAANAQPTLVTTGLTRLFMPWVDAAWPKRTEIVDATPGTPHPSDTALPMRAVLLKSSSPRGEAEVRINYRVIGAPGEAGPLHEAVLAPQPSSDGERGELYERLIEPVAWRSIGDGARVVEYWFESGDDRTRPRRLDVVDRPALVSVRSGIDLPDYAIGFESRFTDSARIEPSATSETLIEIGPVLAGSTVWLEAVYNKSVHAIRDDERSTLEIRVSKGSDPFARGEELRTLKAGFAAERSGRVVFAAEGGSGLRTRGPAVLRLDVARDTPPEATVLEPESDEAVLATATVPLTGEARDDIALAWLRLQYRIARANTGSLGAEPEEGDAEMVVLAREEGEPGPNKRVGAVLEIASLDAEPGDEVWVRAVAQDNYDLYGATHDPVRSSPRKLRIIAPAEFVELIQSELEGVRRTAMRLDAQQADVARRTREAGDTENEDRRSSDLEETARAQSGVSQRLRAQTQMLDRLGERVARNGLDDDAVRALLEQAAQTTGRAADASEQAAEDIAEQAEGEETAPEASQARVREELARLIDQLDRGQDDWVVRRTIERLLSEQTELRDQTEAIGQQTVGRELDQLTPEEQSELERIARQQEQLARRAQDSLDQLADRAEQLREKDPTQAAALDRAAEDAARRQLAQKLQQASEQIGQNQTASAGQMQQQSIEALEQMLEQLENAQKNRDDALRRQLASLIASIESLIRQQEEAIAAVEPGKNRDLKRAETLARRVRTNTLATEASSRGGFGELARVGDLLVRAGASQTDAIVALRASPPDADAALGSETDALARLIEALEEAQRQDQAAEQREQDRKRRELRDAYRAALAEQVALRARSEALGGERLDRRQRAEVRRLGQQQEALRVTIEAIPEEHETSGIGVIELFHERIDAAIADAVRALGRGRAGEPVRRSQSRAVSLLHTILDTLAEQPPRPEDEFAENSGGGGGGGGGGQQGEQPAIENLEQLRLLRGLQAIALDDARAGREPAEIAELQREIAEQTGELIEQMQQQGRPGRPPSPQPAPQPDGPPTESEDGVPRGTERPGP